MRPTLIIPLLAALPLLPGCGVVNALEGCRSGYSRPNIAALTNDLAAARQRWKAAEIQNYSYVIDQFAAPVGFPAARITVRGGQVVSTVVVDPLPVDVAVPPGQTIDQQFADIAQRITAGSTENCQEVSASYDNADGHPLKIDSGTALRGVEDGFGSSVFTDFTRL